MAKLFGLEYVSVFFHVAIVHFLFNILQLSLRKVIENEMILEAVDNEIRIMKRFLFCDNLNIFCNPALNGVDLLSLIVSEKLSFRLWTYCMLCSCRHLNRNIEF